MTKEELNSRIAEIEKEAEEKKRAARKEYVRQNAKYKLGDIVSDARYSILVDRIGITFDWSIYYQGPVVGKRLKPLKNGERQTIFEYYIKEK